MSNRVDELREISGEVDDDRKLVSFLYQLMRDHVPPGVVEEILLDCMHDGTVEYTNGWLARHAQNIADKLGVKDESGR